MVDWWLLLRSLFLTWCRSGESRELAPTLTQNWSKGSFPPFFNRQRGKWQGILGAMVAIANGVSSWLNRTDSLAPRHLNFVSPTSHAQIGPVIGKWSEYTTFLFTLKTTFPDHLQYNLRRSHSQLLVWKLEMDFPFESLHHRFRIRCCVLLSAS